MLYQEVVIVVFSCGSLTKHILLNTFRGDMAEFVFKAGGTCSNHYPVREMFTGVFSHVNGKAEVHP